jgi:hypothetical protein
VGCTFGDELAQGDVGLGHPGRGGRWGVDGVGIAADLGLDGSGRDRWQCVAAKVVPSGTIEAAIEMFLALLGVAAVAQRTSSTALVGAGRRVRSRAGIACQESVDEMFDAGEAGAQVAVLVTVLKGSARVGEAALDTRRAGDLAVALVFPAVALRRVSKSVVI